VETLWKLFFPKKWYGKFDDQKASGPRELPSQHIEYNGLIDLLDTDERVIS
jgi:hypothetical protein